MVLVEPAIVTNPARSLQKPMSFEEMSLEDMLSCPSLPDGIRRSVETMRANVGHRWSVAQLAAVADVSPRTLQRQFSRFLGKSPQTVWQEIGLEQARYELLRGAGGGRVSDVALRCGFPHLGRFSVDYRRRYRETPSSTLKRQGRFVAGSASRLSRPARLHDRPPIALAVALGGADACPEHRALAEHLSGDLATALTRAGLSVTREARFARYRMQAEIRRSGAHERLLVHLTDQENGRQLWAHRSEGVPSGGAPSSERLASRIVARLRPALRQAEIEHARSTPDGVLGPHELALRALPGVLSLDAEGNARALELLERALDRNPDAAFPTALAAWAYAQRIVYHLSADPMAERVRGLELARKAQRLAGDSTVLAVLGNALTLLEEFAAATHVVGQALAIDGGCAWAWSRSGWLDVYRGDAESAIERFKIALDLAPEDSLAFNSMAGMGCAYFKAGKYAEAAYWQQRAVNEHPSSIWMHRTLCPAYLLTGARSEASQSLAALRAGHPDLTVSQVRLCMPPLPQTYRDLVVGALSELGLPA
jgi:AraC-like DNA-binding protein/tetratricopeptide (TPR) repeat protein